MIRAVSPEDVPTLVAIHMVAFPHAVCSRQQLDMLLSSPETTETDP